MMRGYIFFNAAFYLKESGCPGLSIRWIDTEQAVYGSAQTLLFFGKEEVTALACGAITWFFLFV